MEIPPNGSPCSLEASHLEAPPSRLLWRVLRACSIAVLASLCVVLLSLPVGLLAVAVMGIRLDSLSALDASGFATIALATDVALVLVALVLIRPSRGGVRFSIPLRRVPVVIAGCFAVGLVNGFGSWAISRTGEIYTGFPEIQLDFWGFVVVGVAGFIAPLAEELFFREAILVRVFQGTPRTIAILFSSAAFGLLHANAGGPILMATLFLMGLVLGGLRLRTESLGPSILVHALNNLAAVALTLGVKS